MSIELKSIVRRVEDHISAEVDNELVVLSVEQGKYFGFDDIAQSIWAQLKEPMSVDSLCKDLASQFEGSPATIEADVIGLLNELCSVGLIVLES